MSLLNTLMGTCATLSKRVADLEEDKHTQALDILKRKKRVKKLEKKKKLRSLGFKRLRKIGTSQRVDSSADTIVAKELVLLSLLYLMMGRLHDQEIEKASAREKQEKDELERAKVLQKQYEDKEENIDWNAVVDQVQERHIDNIRKYQNLKKKPVSIAQARKNMIIYLKNMTRFKWNISEPDKDVEEPKMKRVAEDILLQESFKKLKAVEVSGSESTQETPFNDPKEISEVDVQNLLEIVLVFEFKVEALQVKYPIINWEIHTEGKVDTAAEVTEEITLSG
nr:hypothetical protein [Tanacetum cinerariifolium]